MHQKRKQIYKLQCKSKIYTQDGFNGRSSYSYVEICPRKNLGTYHQTGNFISICNI